MKDYIATLEQQLADEHRARSRRNAFDGVVTGMILAIVLALSVVAFVEHHWPRDESFLPGGAR